MSTTTQHGPTTEIRLGHGVTAPGGVTVAPRALAPARAGGLRPWQRWALAAAALASPVAMGVQYLFDRTGLPRQDAEVYLAAVAANPTEFVVSTVAYTVAVLTAVAGALVLALVCGRRSPVLTTVALAGAAAATVGGGAFVGLRLAALALTPGGAVRPQGPEVFGWLQAAVIDPMGFLLLGAVLGTLATVAALVRSRRLLGWWVAPLAVVGLVLTSGELPFWVGALGGAVQAAAVLPLVRVLLRDRD